MCGSFLRRGTRYTFIGELLERLGAEVVAADSVPILDQIGAHVESLQERSIHSRQEGDMVIYTYHVAETDEAYNLQQQLISTAPRSSQPRVGTPAVSTTAS